MADDASFIDMHARVVRHLAGQTGTRTSSKVPEDLSAEAIVVFDVSGSDDFVTDTAEFDVHTFAPTRARSWELAEKCRAAMHALAGFDDSIDGRQLVDFVVTVSRPTRVTYGNPGVTRYVATYRVSARVQ